MTLSMPEALAELTELAHTLSDLGAASALLGWDQEVMMPPRGAEGRAHQSATLAGIYHEKLAAPRTGELLARLTDSVANGASLSETERALIREMKRDYDHAVKLPASLVKELAIAQSRGVETWRKAREDDDFVSFASDLDHLFQLNRQVADCFGYAESPYDALLDQYEPGMTASAVAAVFNPFREQTIATLSEIQATGAAVDTSVLDGEWDPQKQWDFGLVILRDVGYDFEAGRQDKSTHPFTQSFSPPFDVRITTRVDPKFLATSIFSSIHEAGHALYELGYEPSMARTPLANSPSLGMHESQSRLWENFVGRSRAFWSHYFPILVDFFPEKLKASDFERFYAAINQVKPSLIRIEADEVTYNLHIILRFELEKALVEGKMKVADLPEAWNAKMKAYLGITPPNNTLGVLQDIHWGTGLIGYFPTYSLGNLIGAQLYYTLRQRYPDFDERVARGEMRFILDWMREHIHRPGKLYSASELIQRATGQPLDPGFFGRYVREKYVGLV